MYSAFIAAKRGMEGTCDCICCISAHAVHLYHVSSRSRSQLHRSVARFRKLGREQGSSEYPILSRGSARNVGLSPGYRARLLRLGELTTSREVRVALLPIPQPTRELRSVPHTVGSRSSVRVRFRLRDY